MFLEILLLLIVFINILLSIFVLTQNPKSISNRLFSVLSFIAAIWTFTNYMTGVNTDVFWLNSSYAFGSLVIATGLIWTITITDKKLCWKKVLPISIISIVFFVCAFVPGFMIESYNQTYLGIVATSNSGAGTIIYLFYYIITAYLILWKLFSQKKISNDLNEKSQLKFIILGALIALLSSFVSTSLPLVFHITLVGLDSIGFLIFLTFIAYSITRHHLFNIRVIAIEMVTFGLWITILVRTLLATTVQDRLIEGGLLVVTVIFGITLIRSTLHVIWQRERIEKLAENLGKAYDSLKDLNTNLEQKVAEQTHEIKRAYEVEKEARRELERLDETKNQLITAAQHNLRTPLTALRWQLEVIRKDADALQHSKSSNTATGSMTKKGFQEAIKESEDSVVTLTRVLEDFLDITALKVGGNETKK